MGRSEVHGGWVYEVERDPSGACQWHTVSPLPPTSAAPREISSHDSVLSSSGGNDSRRSRSRWTFDILSKPVFAVVIVGLAVALTSSQPTAAVQTVLGVLAAAVVLRTALRRLLPSNMKHQVTVMIVQGLGVQIEVVQVATAGQTTLRASHPCNLSGGGSNGGGMGGMQARVVHRQLVPLSMIAAATITEIVTPTSCHFALVLLLADSDQPLPVFQHLKPPLPVLVGVRRAIESCLTS
ncbi:hypothetical protein CLOM_g5033 [Closterium sp. NIES-68]|nr:hypothetical protein CLOM_g5033 [Closterium sp. NIES-68]GJP67786.1 hypothetical protein CLOP_g24557 [Closterium sp. NIES-67]